MNDSIGYITGEVIIMEKQMAVYIMHNKSVLPKQVIRVGTFTRVTGRTEPERLASFAKEKEADNQHFLMLLDKREIEVLYLISCGFDTLQIAGKLNRSERTIEAYRAKIKKKLGLKNSAELLKLAASARWTISGFVARNEIEKCLPQ